MKRNTLSFIGFVAALMMLCTPSMAHASPYVQGILNMVGGTTRFASGGGGGVISMAETIVGALRTMILTMAGLMMVIAAFRMVIAQEDDALTKAKNTFTAAISGVILAFLIEPFRAAFLGGGIVNAGGAAVVKDELTGLMNWATAIIGTVAVAIIIVTGIRALFKSGSEEGLQQMRKCVFAIIAGILLLVFKSVVAVAVGAEGSNPNPSAFIGAAIHIVAFVLGFMVLAAVIVIVYAGILMIVHFGRDDQIQKAKGLIIRALIGLVVILVSYLIVRFVIDAAI